MFCDQSSVNKIGHAVKSISVAVLVGITLVSYPVTLQAKTSEVSYPPNPPRTPPTSGTTVNGGGF